METAEVVREEDGFETLSLAAADDISNDAREDPEERLVFAVLCRGADGIGSDEGAPSVELDCSCIHTLAAERPNKPTRAIREVSASLSGADSICAGGGDNRR